MLKPPGLWLGSRGDVREQLLEGADGDAATVLGGDVVEQLVQRLLAVAVRALEMGVVAAPHDIAPSHRGGRRHRRAVVLERRVDLGVQELARQLRQRRTYRAGVLAVPLVEAVGEERPPRRAALGDEDAQAGVAVARTRRDQLRRRPLAAERRLEVVEDGATRPALVETMGRAVVVRLGADVEPEHHAVVLEGGPYRLPRVGLIGVLAGGGGHREERRLEAETG